MTEHLLLSKQNKLYHKQRKIKASMIQQ